MTGRKRCCSLAGYCAGSDDSKDDSAFIHFKTHNFSVRCCDSCFTYLALIVSQPRAMTQMSPELQRQSLVPKWAVQLIHMAHGEEKLQKCCERCNCSFSPVPAEHTPGSVCRGATASREVDGLHFVPLVILPWVSPGRESEHHLEQRHQEEPPSCSTSTGRAVPAMTLEMQELCCNHVLPLTLHLMQWENSCVFMPSLGALPYLAEYCRRETH